jgi:hypothetical protein
MASLVLGCMTLLKGVSDGSSRTNQSPNRRKGREEPMDYKNKKLYTMVFWGLGIASL